MADWGQNDEVVTPAKTVAPAAKQTSSWGQDDEVVTKPAAKETKPGFLEKSMADYTKKQEERVSGAGAFASSYLESVGASPAALAGARAGMAIPQPVWSKPVTGVVGGIVGGYLASEGITSLESAVDKVFGTNITGTREKQRQEYPGYSLAGSVTGGSLGPFMRPGLPQSIKEAAVGSGIMTGIGMGQRAIEGQPVFDPKSVAIDVATGAFTKPTKLGEKVLGQTAPVTKPKPEIKKEEVTPPPPTATPEQIEIFKDKVKKEADQRASTSPLVEAAIRNKETGEIERMGPKHDEDRKINTTSTPAPSKDVAVRLYRGEGGGQVGESVVGGEWFTTDINKAKKYGNVSYVDLSQKDLLGTAQGHGGSDEFVLSETLRNKAKPFLEEDTHDQGFLDERGQFLTRQEAADRAVNTGQVPVEEYTAKEVAVPSRTKEDINKELQSLKEKLSDAERTDAWQTASNTRKEIKDLEKKLKLVEEFGPTEPKYREVTKTRAKLEIPEDGLHSGDLRKAGDERFKITEEQPAGVPKKPSSPDEPVVDRTKTSPRDVKDEKEFLSIAADIYEKHGEVEAVEFFKGWEEFKKTWPEPVKEVEEFVGINLNNKLANERIVHNNTADIKELAGKDVNLEQLSFDIDRGVTLEGKAKEVATKFRTLMDELGKRALENGVIKGWHENYVARNVVSEGAAPKGALEEFMRDAFGYGEKASGDGTKTTTKYGQERRLKTREDLVSHINGINEWLAENGKDYRFKLKTNNLAEIYKDYALSVEKAIENKNLIENIKQIRNVNGESLIKPISGPEDLPYGWKQIDHPDLAGYAIHPDLVPALKFVFDSEPGMIMKALGTISQAIKRINVIGSFFHAKSLLEVLSSSKIPLWTPVKEGIVLPLTELAAKKTTGKDLQLSAISQAVEQYRRGGLGDNVDLWIKSNMRLESPEDVSMGILSSTGKLADNLIAKFGPRTRILESSLSATEKYTLGMFDKYTWDYLHTGGKIMMADAYLEKARLDAAKEGRPFDEMAARKEIASFVNDSFGGLNWFDIARRTEGEFAKRMAMAAYSPEGRRALQIVLFAPDWTISTVRAFTAALPKNLNPTKWQPIEGIKGMMAPTTKADYARLYQFKTALVYFTLINAINNMTAGRDVWDNKDPTRVEWPDGTSMQAMKHAMEPYHWIADPDKTLSNKMGFIPKALIIGFGGVEYASPTAPKLVDLSGPGRLKAAVGTALPFQLQAGAAAPEGEGAKRALLGTMGFPVYGKTAEQNKQARAERELATKENAWKYRDKEIKKGRMEWTPKHDQEKRALDKRREKLNKETE
jgi:hypothetical protein